MKTTCTVNMTNSLNQIKKKIFINNSQTNKVIFSKTSNNMVIDNVVHSWIFKVFKLALCYHTLYFVKYVHITEYTIIAHYCKSLDYTLGDHRCKHVKQCAIDESIKLKKLWRKKIVNDNTSIVHEVNKRVFLFFFKYPWIFTYIMGTLI